MFNASKPLSAVSTLQWYLSFSFKFLRAVLLLSAINTFNMNDSLDRLEFSKISSFFVLRLDTVEIGFEFLVAARSSLVIK